MIYFAHRGASALHVQNTLPAFKLAHAHGARCFELDVHLLGDGALAVHHDYSLLSTAGQDVKLARLTAADLKKYPLINCFDKQPVFVPLLSDVLPLIRPQLCVLNVEIKNDDNCYPGIEKALAKQLASHTDLLTHVVFSSFDYPTLQRLRELLPGARLGLLTRHFDVEKALALGAQSVHINQTRFSSEMAQTCHANGLKVYVYTVNEVAAAQALAQQGADGIFTDKIHLFC